VNDTDELMRQATNRILDLESEVAALREALAAQSEPLTKARELARLADDADYAEEYAAAAHDLIRYLLAAAGSATPEEDDGG